MATVTATELSIDSSLEQFKEQFNVLRSDVSGVTLASLGFSDGVVFEGATDDDFETTLNATDPTADRTITLPDVTGTVSLIANTETLTNKTLTTPVVNAGLQLKNGATSVGFLEFFEDSDNGTNKVTLIGPAATADVTITLPSTAGTVALTGTSLTIPDGGTIGSASDTDAIAIGADGDVTLTQDLELQHDGAILYFGQNDDVKIKHVADKGLEIYQSTTADVGMTLTFNALDTAIESNHILGKLEFKAGAESSGSDAILPGAFIAAVAEGDFTASSNATKLSFATAPSETAAEKMSLSSAGNLTVSGTVTATAGSTLLIKNSSGSTLKTVKGIS